MSGFAIAGVVEASRAGWTWEQRVEVMRHCAPAGLPWFLWTPGAPVDASHHGEAAAEHELAGLGTLLAAAEGMRLGLCVEALRSADAAGEASALLRRVAPFLTLLEGSGHGPALLVVVCGSGSGASESELADADAELIRALMNGLDDATLVAVEPAPFELPTGSEYLARLSEGLPPEALVVWRSGRGSAVSASDAESFADLVDGRQLLLLDDYLRNDDDGRRIELRPLRGRDELLSEFCAGYLVSAAIQPRLSLPGLLSAAGFAATGAATEVWDEFDQPVQLALLAECASGAELVRLASATVDDPESHALDDLWWWFERIEAIELDGPIGREAQPWVAASVRGAGVALLALDLLERDAGDDEVPELLDELEAAWPSVRDASVRVLGARSSGLPGGGAVDLLRRAALARHRGT